MYSKAPTWPEVLKDISVMFAIMDSQQRENVSLAEVITFYLSRDCITSRVRMLDNDRDYWCRRCQHPSRPLGDHVNALPSSATTVDCEPSQRGWIGLSLLEVAGLLVVR